MARKLNLNEDMINSLFEDDSDDDNINDRDYIPSESEDGEEQPSLLQLKKKSKSQ